MSSPPRAHDPLLAARLAEIDWTPISGPASGRLWRGDERGTPRVLKQVRSERGHTQEAHALQILRGARLPRLLAASGPRLLLLSALPGAPAIASPPRVHAAAGAWLRTLHARQPATADPLPLHEALHRRARAALDRAARHGPVHPRIRAGIDPDRPFPAGPRVWCHRDFTPRNWLWCPDAGLGIVDLEHARPDHPALDIVKLETELWPGQPRARAAFCAAYGPLPDADLRRRLGWLHGLQTRTWGRDHADPDYTALGERILAQLSAPPTPAGGTPASPDRAP